MDIKRVVVWTSGGVTSAIAGKIATYEYKGVLPVHLVNTDTGSEDADNMRFMLQSSAWIGLPLEIIRNEKFIDTFAVYESSNFFKGPHGAKCTVELKKVPRRKYEDLAGDLQVFGFDADEQDRAEDFVMHNPEINTWFPLIEAGITKSNARQILLEAGIKEPRTYSEGFKNANCLERGCVNGGMGYWNHMRKVRPRVFWNMAAEERKIGYAICSKEIKGDNGERVKIPVYLDELAPDAGNYDAEPAFQCGLFCQLPDKE